MATTTLKLPAQLKARIARIAAQTGRSAHHVMLEALEREVARAERVREFVREALASDAAVEAGAAVYRAEDVHAWLERLAGDGKRARHPRGRGYARPDAGARRIGTDSAMAQPVVTSSPDILGGTSVFTGTRVPVQTLLDYLVGGESLDAFLEGFPSVRREQAISFLEQAKLLLTDDVVRDAIEKARR